MMNWLTVLGDPHDDRHPQTDLILYWILLSTLKWASTWPVGLRHLGSPWNSSPMLFCNTSNTKKRRKGEGKIVPIPAWNKMNTMECRESRPHLEVEYVQPAGNIGGINACSINPSGFPRLLLIFQLKEAPGYNCLLSQRSSCHAEVADGDWQSGVTMGFLQTSPEADQNYEAHKNNHVNNLLCRQDDGSVILSFKAEENSSLSWHMPSSSMKIIAERAAKRILTQKNKKR